MNRAPSGKGGDLFKISEEFFLTFSLYFFSKITLVAYIFLKPVIKRGIIMLKRMIAVSVFSCFALEALHANLPDGVTQSPDGSFVGPMTMTVPSKDQGKNSNDIKVVYKDLKGNAVFHFYCTQPALSRAAVRGKAIVPEAVLYEMNGALTVTFKDGETLVAPGADREGPFIRKGLVSTAKHSKGTTVVFLKNQKLAEDADVIACSAWEEGKKDKTYAIGKADATEITISNDGSPAGIKIEFDKTPSLGN